MSYVAKRQIGKVKIITIIYFMICLMPFLRYYNFPGISVGIELLLVIGILVLYLLLITRSTYKSEILQIKRSRKWFAIFLVWAVLITFFYEVFTEYNVSNSLASVSIFGYISTIITALVIFMLMNDGYHNYVSFIKIYSFFVWLTLLVYLFQWGLYILGIKVGFNIPFLDFSSGWDNVKGITFGMNGLPSGLFSERAHFCQFFTPYITLCLFSKNSRIEKPLVKAVIVSVAVISTVSGNGVIIIGIVWMMYFLLFGNTAKRNKIIVSVLGIITIVIVFIKLQELPVFNEMFLRLFADKSGSSYYYSKADYRIYRGFNVYSKLPFAQKLLGVGFKHMQMFANGYSIISFYDRTNVAYEYFSTVTQILIYFGLFGFFSFVNHVFQLLKTRLNVVRAFLVVMIALWFSSSIFLDCMHVLYIASLIAVIKYEYSERYRTV